MKMIRENWPIFPLLFIGYLYNNIRTKRQNSMMIFDDFIFEIIMFLFAIFFIIALIKDFKKNKKAKTWKNFIPTMVGFMVMISFVISNFFINSKNNSPTIIHAYYDDYGTGAWIEFKKDGTYKFANRSMIGAEYVEGKYSIKDSIITLDKSKIDNVIKTNTLAIREIKNNDSNAIKVAYQINQKHKIIDKKIFFIISKYESKKK